MEATTTDSRQVGGDHYTRLKIQPWEAMEAWLSREAFRGFLLGNVIKYVARAERKGGLQDLEKAAHYLDKLIEIDTETAIRGEHTGGQDGNHAV